MSIERAISTIDELLHTIADGSYRYERVHLEADLNYLRALLAARDPAPDETLPEEALIVMRVAVSALIETGRHNVDSAADALVRAAERLAPTMPTAASSDLPVATRDAAEQYVITSLNIDGVMPTFSETHPERTPIGPFDSREAAWEYARQMQLRHGSGGGSVDVAPLIAPGGVA